jgi:hypothetical protein
LSSVKAQFVQGASVPEIKSFHSPTCIVQAPVERAGVSTEATIDDLWMRTVRCRTFLTCLNPRTRECEIGGWIYTTGLIGVGVDLMPSMLIFGIESNENPGSLKLSFKLRDARQCCE